ncbi:MAG: MotA/TolQ/ExbB proton channel family protein [Gammaproteobacteria bacterium]|nr:MotA/TolQ/ExbB proton channel family protein [Gammaproteobacteria bacterium]
MTIHPDKGYHHLLLTWLIFIGAVVFSLIVAWHQGVLELLYMGDKSKISWAITLLFLLITAHVIRRVWVVSTQINAANEVSDFIRKQDNLMIRVIDDHVDINGKSSLPPSYATQYIHDLVTRYNNHAIVPDDIHQNNSDLIEVYESKLKGPHEIGWFVADVMIKLGLLGTIIGFILMLGSVVNVADFDVTTMQKILRHMSSGMGTALYTTMAGLVCSMLASAQYHMLERYIDEMIENMKHLTQVHVMPRIHQGQETA